MPQMCFFWTWWVKYQFCTLNPSLERWIIQNLFLGYSNIFLGSRFRKFIILNLLFVAAHTILLLLLPFHCKWNLYTYIYLNYILCITFWGRYFMIWREEKNVTTHYINILYRFCWLNIYIHGTMVWYGRNLEFSV